MLAAAEFGRGDTVSVMLLNTPAMIEAHYGVPMSGAVLHSLNTRLDAATIAFQLDHAEAKILIVDIALLPRVRDALALAKCNPQLIIYDDAEFDGPRSGYDETPAYFGKKCAHIAADDVRISGPFLIHVTLPVVIQWPNDQSCE